MAGVPQPPIVTCAQWGARATTRRPRLLGRPQRAIVHHTAGHHAELEGPRDESRAELFRYARAIQAFHMAPGGLGVPSGWVDSGQNFLIGRNGMILEGRHGSIAALRLGLMVDSAHCPGQNDQPGVEHEHVGHERMTDAQAAASVWLFAWLCDRTGPKGIRPTALYGHGAFYATSCPANLPVLWLRGQVAKRINYHGRSSPSRLAAFHSVTGGRLLRMA